MSTHNGDIPTRPHPDAKWDDFGGVWEHPDDLLYRSAGKSFFMPVDSMLFDYAKQAGYNKIGIAFGIYDTDGNLLLVEHKKKTKNNVSDNEWSIPSESVKGMYDEAGKFIVGETIEQTLWRCVTDELGVDLGQSPKNGFMPELGFRQRPLVWDLAAEQDGKPENQVFGYDVRLLVNDAFRDWLMRAGNPTAETYRFEFFTPDEVKEIIEHKKTRNGFPEWYELQEFFGKFVPDTRKVIEPQEPAIDEKFTWRGTRFAAYAGSIVVKDTEIKDFI